MKKIFIVGGGGFALECYQMLSLSIAEASDELCFGGFMSHNGNNMDCKHLKHLYLGDVSLHKFSEDEYCIIGVGMPHIRKRIFFDLKKMGAKLYNFVSKGSVISDSVEMGEGNILLSTCSLANISIGDGNLFNGEVILGHDSKIGSFNFFAPRTNVLGNVKIGDGNIIGTGSVLLPGCKVGSNNKIAPLSAVYKGCKDNAYMLGNPALKVGNNDPVED